MNNKLASFGEIGLQQLQALGQATLFLFQLLFRLPSGFNFWPMVKKQVHFLGTLSCLIVIVSALFIGMVIGLQGYHILKKFGGTAQLGQLLALAVLRELSPVLSALLFAGRAGSAVTAEIGLMKATEQLTSMEMIGVDPIGYVMYPRFLAGLFVLPLLNFIFSCLAIYGGYFVAVACLGLDQGTFWSNMQAAVHFRVDVFSSFVKSFAFAFIIMWIALFQGNHCAETAESISQATTKTVVYTSLAVLGLDFLLTAMMIGDW